MNKEQLELNKSEDIITIAELELLLIPLKKARRIANKLMDGNTDNYGLNGKRNPLNIHYNLEDCWCNLCDICWNLQQSIFTLEYESNKTATK